MQAALRPEGYEDVGSMKTWEREFQAEGAARAQARCACEGERETVRQRKERGPNLSYLKVTLRSLCFIIIALCCDLHFKKVTPSGLRGSHQAHGLGTSRLEAVRKSW